VPAGQTPGTQTAAGECRQCRGFCDKLIEPAGCIAIGCRYLYTYEDITTGRRFMGCVNKVFSGEIDLDLFLLAERSGSYGGIKMSGDPLPQCQFSVEKAYEGDGPAYECVNRTFFDTDHDSPEGIKAFDLRNALA
jgi:hypothetical protein